MMGGMKRCSDPFPSAIFIQGEGKRFYWNGPDSVGADPHIHPWPTSCTDSDPLGFTKGSWFLRDFAKRQAGER